MIVLIVLAIAVIFSLSIYLYAIGGRRTCPRCGSRNTYVRYGLSATGPIFNCRQCGLVFSANGIRLDD